MAESVDLVRYKDTYGVMGYVLQVGDMIGFENQRNAPWAHVKAGIFVGSQGHIRRVWIVGQIMEYDVSKCGCPRLYSKLSESLQR